MNKLKLVALMSVVAAFASPLAQAEDSKTMQRTYILGESLDSGLGDLPVTYTGKEFDRKAAVRATVVIGEKLDSGLGELPVSYTAKEFQRKTTARMNAVPGEKLDSGLSAAPADQVIFASNKR